MKNVIIKDSLIHGKGVFANRDFEKGEVVLEWKAKQILSTQEMEQISSDKKRYCSYFGDDKWILFDEPCCYVNHSCTPNTEAINKADVAKKYINKGDEITTNYVAEKVAGVEFDCECTNENCLTVVKS